jgi:hypothetical protein
MQPVYISLNGTKMANKLNSMMDHVWDGFYSGQKRLSRFPGLIDGNQGVYNLTFTGSPAKKMTFTYFAQNKSGGMTLRIAYPSTVSRSLMKDGKKIEYTKWNETLHMYGPITQSYCGENRYIGVKNIFEFYLTTDCKIQIVPRDAI